MSQHYLDQILEAWLPSKLSRMIMGLSISLALGIWLPTRYLQIVGLSLSQEGLSFARIVGVPWLLLSAFVITHILVLREMKSFKNLKNWKLSKKVKIALGEYYDVLREGNKVLATITLRRISAEEHSATISFLSGYAMLHGPYTKKLPRLLDSNEELFVFSESKDLEQEHSVFSFRPDNSIYALNPENSGCFFACYVSHINPTAQEVELNIYYLWVKYA